MVRPTHQFCRKLDFWKAKLVMGLKCSAKQSFLHVKIVGRGVAANLEGGGIPTHYMLYSGYTEFARAITVFGVPPRRGPIPK